MSCLAIFFIAAESMWNTAIEAGVAAGTLSTSETKEDSRTAGVSKASNARADS